MSKNRHVMRNFCLFILEISNVAYYWPSVDNVDSYCEVINVDQKPTCLQICWNRDILQKLGKWFQKLKNDKQPVLCLFV